MPKVVVTGICNACGKPFERKFYDEIKSLKPEMLKILMDRYNQRQ